jgi:hypothetical protein
MRSQGRVVAPYLRDVKGGAGHTLTAGIVVAAFYAL